MAINVTSPGTEGTAASGVTDDGSAPVKIGGVSNTTFPTLANGTVGIAQLDTRGGLLSTIKDGNGTRLAVVSSSGDGITNSGVAGLEALAFGFIWNGASFDRVRTPNIFKTASLTTTGSNAVWTPTAGKKFRLMAYILEVTANASLAAGAVNTFSWLDSAAAINLVHSDFEPTAAVTTGEVGYTTGWIILGNGYLSTAANNVLNLSIGTTLATGVCRVNVIGTEE